MVQAEKILDENWETFTSFFPKDWEEIARETRAVTRLRNFKSVEDMMRGLLLHLAQGKSLRETAAILKEAGIANLSDVALMERLQAAEQWFKKLSLLLLKEANVAFPRVREDVNLRMFDATIVCEPGKTGSQWRVHYSFQIPSFNCDHFEITSNKGKGAGESLKKFPIKKGDYIIGDRAYSTPVGIEYVESQGAHVLVRVNTSSLPLFNGSGNSFNLLNKLKQSLQSSGDFKEWTAYTQTQTGKLIQGRLCVVKKTKKAAELCRKKMLQTSSKKQKKLREDTLEYADYVIIFSTFPKDRFKTKEILELYRSRWQIEIAFKRLKSVAKFGHLPKYDDISSRAWLYGKLFVGLVVEKMMRSAQDFFPWGCRLPEALPR